MLLWAVPRVRERERLLRDRHCYDNSLTVATRAAAPLGGVVRRSTPKPRKRTRPSRPRLVHVLTLVAAPAGGVLELVITTVPGCSPWRERHVEARFSRYRDAVRFRSVEREGRSSARQARAQ